MAVLMSIVCVSQAAAAGRGEQRAEVVRSLSQSEHRETRGGERKNISSPGCFAFSDSINHVSEHCSSSSHVFLCLRLPGKEEAAG